MDENVIHELIHEMNDYKVMLDYDLAELYGVTTKALNQAMKRNLERFPLDFCFQLTKEQWESLRSQIVTSSSGPSFLPQIQRSQIVTLEIGAN